MSAEGEASKVTEALHELNVQQVIQLPKLGPIDLSISNAVIYMWLSALVVFVFFFIISRRLRKQPDALQTLSLIHI